MNTNFTPGPWVLASVIGYGRMIIATKDNPDTKSGYYSVDYEACEVGTAFGLNGAPQTSLRYAEALANDTLKAAAPEMYECLEGAVKMKCVISGCGCYSNGECVGSEGVCNAQKWIKILKKARGEK